MQVNRTGLYSQEDELAGMAEANSDDAQEADWAPAADPDSPNYYGELGDVSGSRKLQSSRKRVKGVLRNFLPFTAHCMLLRVKSGTDVSVQLIFAATI